ncbi:MAG: hypothetical protein IK117_11090 [Bacteroidales bacterium]|nr:hypothetical protein [Bacteroidales bacterium]
MKKVKPYRIIGAYDSETTNINIDGIPKAFPIVHQLGLLDDHDLSCINNTNVEEHVNIELYRHSLDLYTRLDEMVSHDSEYIPVILCHNLSFDMYGLAPWLSRHDVKVLAKSARKPITFTILDDFGKPSLVIWDTLIFTQQSLARMGKDCGYSKAIGEWDYDLIRTPETPLTENEIDYAKRDIYTLLCWFAWFEKRNPDIDHEKLAHNVVTKTGIVRERRKKRFSKLRGYGMKRNVQYYWLTRCKLDEPKTDDELFTMLACTRGGFTFCASESASIPYDFTDTGKTIVAYDATSQHPAQIVSHLYPYRFREMPTDVLELAFDLIGKVTIQRVLDMWEKPFPVAFNACFEFENLRPRKGTLFERNGIYPLASARYKSSDQLNDNDATNEYMNAYSYIDCIDGAITAFGKVISAKKARLYLTELASWEVWQVYEWDSVRAIHGYETGKFCKPNDIDVISIMQFYKAKNEFKESRKQYYKSKTVTNGEKLVELGIAPAIVDEMEKGVCTETDIEATYLSLKADLNAIFGISASNQYRRNTVLTPTGIEYEGEFGLCNAPKTSKVWYQFGQRIVAWSRIAQIVAMNLLDHYCISIVNGDTDSIKLTIDENRIAEAENELSKLGKAIDKAKAKVCSRVKHAYPNMYDELTEIGYYVREFESKRFCASWNKAYCIQDESGFHFTLAGIPTSRRENGFSCFIGINGYADRLYKQGKTFEYICNLFLGYNVTFSNDLIKMNARKFPEWGEVFTEKVTDYLGNSSLVVEPCALSIYPMSKTVNDTRNKDNETNMRYAVENNPNVNTDHKIVLANGIMDLSGVFEYG